MASAAHSTSGAKRSCLPARIGSSSAILRDNHTDSDTDKECQENVAICHANSGIEPVDYLYHHIVSTARPCYTGDGFLLIPGRQLPALSELRAFCWGGLLSPSPPRLPCLLKFAGHHLPLFDL